MAERLNVNPTRMVLTTLKRQLAVAVRGHKLLKDKRDELMKQFLDLARENKNLREEVEEALVKAYSGFSIAGAVMNGEALQEALMFSTQGVEIDVGQRNVMSVDVPVFQFNKASGVSNNIYPYGYAFTSGELDSSIKELSEIFPKMLLLAEKEKQADLMAQEIEKTRRRVNALEYVKIPQYTETIRFIVMKLDENERASQTRLMKVKDMMLEKAIDERRVANEEAFEEFDKQKNAVQ